MSQTPYLYLVSQVLYCCKTALIMTPYVCQVKKMFVETCEDSCFLYGRSYFLIQNIIIRDKIEIFQIVACQHFIGLASCNKCTNILLWRKTKMKIRL